MQEDIKVIVTADTAQAEKQIDKMDGKEVEVKAKLKVPKNHLQEVKNEVDLLGKKVADIKMNKKAFSPEDIKILKAEIEAAALKAKAIYFGEGSRSAKEMVDRLKEMHKALAEGKKQVKETNQIFGSMDVMIGSLKAKIIASIVNTLKQGVAEGAKLTGQLEYATEKTRTISTANRGIINSEVDRIGKKFGTDYREVSEGLYQVVSAIGDVHKKYALLETSNKLAITGFSSVNESVDGLTTVLNAYNLEIEEADRIANIFVRTQKVGKLTVQEFQQQLYRTVPVAKELGISVDEIGASIALLTAKGSKAEVAQTQMASFMYELLDTASDVNKLFTRLAGQSIDTYMKNGGNLEGILRTLKEYSNQSGFKVESLFGRKEAKSYWLSIGNDIKGYLEKLNAINDPFNELERNVDNLMATMEKRIERGARYWDNFKMTIGGMSLEVLASIGDIVTGHDKEMAARKKVNIEIENSIKTLEELGRKSDKTKEEQEKLNEALKVLEILAPEIAEAYKQWAKEGGNYAEVLSLIKKRQAEVNDSFAEMSYTQAKKQREDTEKEIKKIDNKLNPMEFSGSPMQAPKSKLGVMLGEYSWDNVTDTQKQEWRKQYPENFLKNAELAMQREALKKRLEEEKKQENELKRRLEIAAGVTEDFSSSVTTFKSDTVIAQETHGKVKPTEEKYKTKQQIEADTSKKLIEAQQKYTEKLSKLASSDFEGKEKLDEAYKTEVEKIKKSGELEKYRLEKSDLEKSIVNETDAFRVNEVKNEIDKISLKIQDLEGQIKIADVENRIDNAKKSEDERKKAEEKAKKEIEKKNKSEQLKIDTEYNKKMLEATEKYNKDMTALKEKGTKEEIEAVKKAYEKAKRDIETEKKIKTLENKKENTFYSTDTEKKVNTEAITSEIALTMANAEKEEVDQEAKEAQEKNTKALENMSNNLKNLANMFQVIGDNTSSQSLKNISNIANIGSTIFDTLKGTEQGANLLTKVFGSGAIPGFKDFSMGAGIGSAISGALGGGAEGNIGSMIGSGIGAIAGGGPVGSIVGGAIGSVGGSLFGRKSKKKKKREEKRRKEAQERLKKGLISGQYKWADVVEAYNEDLARLGAGSYINLYDRVQANTNYDTNLSTLEAAKVGHDGVSMTTLKQLMPQYSEQQIIDWFKSITGGAVLNGDTLSTGEGKYGAIDITALAQQVTNVNREVEKSLKETIKGIIDFSADSLAQVVKNGFFNGLDDLGNNLEKMLANSLKNAFINTEISKALFNGMSDKVSEIVKDMFRKDANLGIQLETGNLENLTLTQYIELIKKYMEASNEKLEDLFKELGMNLDNLTNSVDSLNKNMSKNTVQGMATNLWKYNAGQKVTTEFSGTFEIPIMLDGQVLDKRIIKVTSDSMRKARRNKF
ncbi:phage tail tape measure protein [Fusobacterium varium]|uniref:phage tail tape measure protein n=1 Tax=Fusobacterium varium TaxID=856 RepID=UPI00189A4DD4|nr:phage tail tape measure protein [Fusobacterium varium]